MASNNPHECGMAGAKTGAIITGAAGIGFTALTGGSALLVGGAAAAVGGIWGYVRGAEENSESDAAMAAVADGALANLAKGALEVGGAIFEMVRDVSTEGRGEDEAFSYEEPTSEGDYSEYSNDQVRDLLRERIVRDSYRDRETGMREDEVYNYDEPATGIPYRAEYSDDWFDSGPLRERFLQGEAELNSYQKNKNPPFNDRRQYSDEPDSSRSRSYSERQSSRAVEVGWHKRTNGNRVERAVEEMWQKYPDKKIIIATGAHGEKGRGFVEHEKSDFVDEEFLHEDQDMAMRMKAKYPERSISVRDMGNSEEYLRFKNEMGDPNVIGIRGECYGADNFYFLHNGGGRSRS